MGGLQIISPQAYGRLLRFRCHDADHDQRLIEFEADKRRARISSKGAKDVDDRLLK